MKILKDETIDRFLARDLAPEVMSEVDAFLIAEKSRREKLAANPGRPRKYEGTLAERVRAANREAYARNKKKNVE